MNYILLLGKKPCQHQQVWARCRNDPDSSSLIGSVFATEINSNFIIRVRNTTNHEHSLSNQRSFQFQFCGNRSSVTIHRDHFDFKTLQKIQEAKLICDEIMNIPMENTLQKWTYICKNSTRSCIQTSMRTTKTICWVWILVRNMGEYVFCSWFKPFLCAIHCLFSTADLPNGC